MKRFGVQLAGAAGVVLLGVLAVVMAQKAPAVATAELDQELQTTAPAAPIAELSSDPWGSDSTIFRGNDPADAPQFGGAAIDGAVQLANHEQPSEANAEAGPGFAMPSAAAPADSADAAAAATLSIPTTFPGASASEFPDASASEATDESASDDSNDVPSDGSVDAAADLAVEMPTLDLSADGPSNADLAAQQADEAEEMPAVQTGLSTQNTLRGSVTAQASDAPQATDAPEQDLAPQPSDAPQQDLGGYSFQPAEMRTAASGSEALQADTSVAPPSAYQAAPTIPANDPPSVAYGATAGPDGFAGQANQAPQLSPAPAQLSPAPAQLGAAPAQLGAAPAMAPPAERIASRDTDSLSGMGSSPALQHAQEHVMGQPGDRRWEGAQAPSVLIHKRAPEEVKVGKPATFVIDVRNVGTTDAYNVQVHDRVPEGMRLIDATPQPTGTPEALTWSLGGLEPGGERSITLQLVPEAEGELGSVARVTFEAAASVRTISTRPELRIRQRAPERVLIGQQLELEITIENIGTGTAAGVILQADIPEGLEHPKGRQLDNLIGDLRPGESRTQILRLRATGGGTVENIVRLLSDDDTQAQDAVAVEIVAPHLAVELQGPSKRFLERQATYNISLANTGTANATNVEVIAYLDRGFTFVSTENEGQYDPSRHAVYWSLAELPTGANGLVPLTLLPVEEGEQAVRLEVTGDLGVHEKSEKMVQIDTLAELSFAVADQHDPVETGGETTYEIRITNSGSRGDSNVQLQVKLPAELELVSADRNAGTDGQGLIAFEPLPRMTPDGEEIYRLRVRGLSPGTHIIQAILTSDQSPVAVTKEESTTVYSDQ